MVEKITNTTVRLCKNK